MKQQRVLPAPVIQQAPNTANAVASMPPAPSAPPPAAAPKLRSVVVTSQQSIDLIDPVIELKGDIFIGEKLDIQTHRLRPKRATIVNGAIIIEELNLILPLAGNFVRTS